MKKSITKTKILFILLILIIGIIGYKNIPVQSNEITPVNDEKPQKNLGIPTEIVKVTKENLVEKISYIGTIQSKETVLVSPKIPAEIVELNIAEGDYVKKGEILARLDDSNIRAKL
jgi:multidrug efflux pump subunit AcrA (membrane-fusion protein)